MLCTDAKSQGLRSVAEKKLHAKGSVQSLLGGRAFTGIEHGSEEFHP